MYATLNQSAENFLTVCSVVRVSVVARISFANSVHENERLFAIGCFVGFAGIVVEKIGMAGIVGFHSSISIAVPEVRRFCFILSLKSAQSNQSSFCLSGEVWSQINQA